MTVQDLAGSYAIQGSNQEEAGSSSYQGIRNFYLCILNTNHDRTGSRRKLCHSGQ
ncbi:hypothetical protein [Chryseobacterium hispalense]|uniref:hypothetical protein n=1 Tax=Chryseobacterium hispalense TaxID=1453492 RepID=UPI00391CF968